MGPATISAYSNNRLTFSTVKSPSMARLCFAPDRSKNSSLMRFFMRSTYHWSTHYKLIDIVEHAVDIVSSEKSAVQWKQGGYWNGPQTTTCELEPAYSV